MGTLFQSLLTLALGFGAVLAVTLGLAGAFTSPHAGARGEDGGMAHRSPTPVEAPTDGIARLGGTLTVTGDREGTLRLTSENRDGRYTLVGDAGRIGFEGAPLEIVRLSFDGWDFFLDPGECALEPRDLDTAIGIGLADVRCDEIADIRENGVISVEGTVGLPVDLLADRSLPGTGGTAQVGGETWTFEEAWLLAWQLQPGTGSQEHNLELVDDVASAALGFHWNVDTRRLTLVEVERNGQERSVPAEACDVQRSELGRHNPQTVVAELTISCSAVDVPDLGNVPIEATVVVDELELPASG